mmetsp:Transcript_162238/g.394192  ORF Transcript_162238/g.394192 Transcript_162238/m.394192 type:complete len:281 (+) Transcript_162238:56-898(+)
MHWIIDGRKDDVPAGTIYQITFSWLPDRKSVTWEQAGSSELEVLGYEYEHKFYLSGSWRRFDSFQEMVKKEGEDVYEGKFTIGYRCVEEFHIVRDGDAGQAIYPCLAQCMSTAAPIMGPDANGKGKNFTVKGKQHQQVTVRVSLVDSKASVTVVDGSGEKTWHSWEGWATQTTNTFYVRGSFNQGRSMPMLPDENNPGVHTCRVALDNDGTASFHIVVNEDKSLILHPDEDLSLLGPDAEESLEWFMEGPPGASYDVKLDLTQKDRKQMVSWQPGAKALK